MPFRKSNLPAPTVAKKTLNKKAEQIAADRVTDAADINTGTGPHDPDVKNDARTAYKPGSSTKPQSAKQSPHVPSPVHSDPIKNPAAQANKNKGKQGGSRPTESDEQRNMFAKGRSK